MPQSLVVLTDFFAVSNQALSYAAGLAVPLKAHLLLLHTRHDALLAPVDENFDEHRTWVGAETTFHHLEDLAATQPVTTQVEISGSALAEAVQEATHHQPALLVVLGRPGATTATASPDLLTRTALHLLRHAPHPLLVVPGPGNGEAFPPRRLLLAVDGQPFRLHAPTDLLHQLLHALPATLEAVYVTNYENNPPDLTAIRATVCAPGRAAVLPEQCLHVVSNTSVVAGILQAAADREADLLLVVARPHNLLGRLFHGSVTAGLLRESPIPVLVLPATE
jgi:nucleotide-binding universal stress UspA family protein